MEIKFEVPTYLYFICNFSKWLFRY